MDGDDCESSKCQCISLEGSTGKLKDHHLHINVASIPSTKDSVRFLGLNVLVASHHVSPRSSLDYGTC